MDSSPNRSADFVLLAGAAWLSLAACAFPAERLLDPGTHHLRPGAAREWEEFPETPEGPDLTVRFPAARNPGETTLRLRQEDVKLAWKVFLNDAELGRLITDENPLILQLAVPTGRLVDGENLLRIEPVDRKTPDDIRVGEIALDDRPAKEVLSEATVEVRVSDAEAPQNDLPFPCRLTIVDATGALVPLAASGDRLAVRTGVIYTADGRARFGLAPGSYVIHAGRGFEYGVDSAAVTLRRGDSLRRELRIRREVPTEGYLSCDPHLHTLTHSGHGDATTEERALTLAGEGIELAVATEHNLQIDYQKAAEAMGVRRFFTPVAGNEVTTAAGHFNIFPVRADGPVPDHRLKSWKEIGESIRATTGAPVIILNHPRDLHLGFRPFGPERHQPVSGESLDGWTLFANAMEVVNSGAQQTDALLPYRDWFALLNRGVFLTPVGASDSHDVSRFIAGQARTYLRAEDGDPGRVDLDAAVASLRAGRVLVSCGLLADLRLNGAYGPGDLAPRSPQVEVEARVLGPGWVTAEKVVLYSNGTPIREAVISGGDRPGVKWSGKWSLPCPTHDVHLVAIATGPGVTAPYWPIAKPYQPASPRVGRRAIGSTGAVWIDGDGDGRPTCARETARRLLEAAEPRTTPGGPLLPPALRDHDEAVAAQAAALLAANGQAVAEERYLAAARAAGPQVERGFRAFIEAEERCRAARAKTGGR